MVADEGVHVAAGPPRLRLKPHQMIENGAAVGTAVLDIAKLYEVCAPPSPVAGGVDQARRAQHVFELIGLAVEVAEHDNASDVVERRLRARLSRSAKGEHRQTCNEKSQPPDHRPKLAAIAGEIEAKQGQHRRMRDNRFCRAKASISWVQPGACGPR